MPDAICSFPLLTKISMHQNLIAGQFPDCWQSNSSLMYVFLSGNNLTGTLPESISKLPNLLEFWVDANRIGGTLPSSWGQIKSLQILSLYTNLLVGTIPPSFGNLSSLVSVYMDMNSLNGTIPPELGQLSMISELYASVNQISGTIPPELSQLSQLTALVLFNNRLEGTIPSALSSLSNLITLSLDTNKLVGTIPSSLGNLMNMEWLSLYSNRLNGTIPSALFNLKKLGKLKLNNNTLTGSIPSNIGNLTSLQTCLLSNNYFVGTLPESISRLSQLSYLSLSQNQFQGDSSTLSRMSNLTALTRLELQQNNFVGNFDFLTSTFSPIFINASFNSFGPVLQDYKAPASGTGISFIDLSSNVFECPYPDSYPNNVVLKLSSCLIPWDLYGRYAAILAGAVAFVILVLAGIRILLGKDRTTIVKFFISWATFTVAVVMDALNVREILNYLLASTDNCVNFNYHYIFQPVMPYVIYDDDKLPKMMSFADWNAKYISMYSIMDPGVPQNRAAFTTLCQSLDQCYVPDNEYKCVLRSGMGNLVPTYSIFFRCVIAIAVVRGFIEIIRLIVISYSCWRGGRVFGGRRTINFIIPSPFTVLLMFANKTEFYRSVVMHHPKYTDIMRSSFHIGLLTQAPLLAANVFFLLRVTQVGVNFANMLSLINGLLLVPRLIMLTLTSWIQHRSLIQKHSEDVDDAEHLDDEVAIRLDPNTRTELKTSPLIESLIHGAVFD
jgi:Leucine-rich repeat (LRR) protein